MEIELPTAVLRIEGEEATAPEDGWIGGTLNGGTPELRAEFKQLLINWAEKQNKEE